MKKQEEAPGPVSDFFVGIGLFLKLIAWSLSRLVLALKYSTYRKGRNHIAFLLWYTLLFPLNFPAIYGMFYRESRKRRAAIDKFPDGKVQDFRHNTQELFELRRIYTLIGLTLTSNLIVPLLAIAVGISIFPIILSLAVLFGLGGAYGLAYVCEVKPPGKKDE